MIFFNVKDVMDTYPFAKDLEEEYIAHATDISNQELLCKGWFHLPNTYDCGSFVVN
mgnify:CR=1 FL=1